MSKFFLVIIPLLFFSQLGHSQEREKLNISIGTGLNECINLGVRYQLNQMQFGVAIGTDFKKKKEINNPEIYTGEVLYHFAGTAELSERRPWYFRNGVVLRKEDYNYTDLRTFIWSYNLRIGREFNISRKIGISLDGGIIARLKTNNKEIGPNPSYPDYVEHPIDPSFGLGLYYRFF